MVRYVLGRASKGKSRYIFEEIKERLDQGFDQKILLLVPEQFTLQTERDLLQSIQRQGIMQVEVLSMSSLSNRVLTEAGGITRTLLNEQGRNMVLRKIIEEQLDTLSIFKKAARQEGFVVKLADMIRELKQNAINTQTFKEFETSYGPNEILGQKVRDISILYEQLEGYLGNRYVDTEDRMNLFIQKLPYTSLVRDSCIYIDGFSTFSIQSLRVIQEIIRLAPETTISFTLPPFEESTITSSGSSHIKRFHRDENLFQTSEYSLSRIREMVKSHGIQEEYIHIDPSQADQRKCPELIHLEKEIYAYPFKVCTADVDKLSIFAAMNIYSEVEHVAAQIIELVRDVEDYRWRDIVVVCNDMSQYGPILARSFKEYGIPFFMDQKNSIMNNPIIRLILAVLDIVERNYQYEDVFAYLKTGFSDLEPGEYEILENYVLRYGVRGSRWKDDFTWGDDAEFCNLYREKIIAPLEKLEKTIKKQSTIREQTASLYDFLEAIHIQEKLEEWIDRLRERELFEYVRTNAQIWNIVIDSLDQMVEILGDQELDLKEYRRILEAGFQSYEVGIIPTTLDQVLVGSIGRSKSTNIKALFVMGINDGVLPSRAVEEDILTEEEKEMLRGNGLNIGLQPEMKAEEEKFLIYNAFAKPDGLLNLSYALSDTEGKALRPSLLIDRIRSLFPRIKLSDDLVPSRENELATVSRPESTFKFLFEHLRMNLDGKEIFDSWWDVYGWYVNNQTWDHQRTAMIGALFHQNQVQDLGFHQAQRVYQWPMRASVSRVEQFIQCPFSHFVHYGLRPAERKTYEIESPDIGEIFHHSLQRFADEVAVGEGDFRDLDREKSDRLMDRVMQDVIQEHGNGVLNSSHRYQYLARRLGRISRRAAWTLTEHLKKGTFEPLGTEVAFGMNAELPPVVIQLANGEKMMLEGRIDRIDVMEDGDAAYIKVIDYKSGSKQIKLSDIYQGMNLQLLVYLLAVLSSGEKLSHRELKPGGVFYFHIDDPFVESADDVLEKIEMEIQKKLKMTGLVLEDLKVVQGMDSDIQQHSDVIPVGLKKDGSFDSRSAVLSEENFTNLLRHVTRLLARNGQEIQDGKIMIEPAKSGMHSACEYCLYRSICQFDRSMELNHYRQIRPLPDEEVVRKIQEGGDSN